MAAIIVDYGGGNLRSVQRAFAEIGTSAEISSDPKRIRDADRIIFPGVGAAGSAMRAMREGHLDEALCAAIASGVPTLGICLGLQISLDHSEENDTPTLGIIPGRVRRFALNDPTLKVPHMGWNEVHVTAPHPVLADIKAGDQFYFVHAYYPEPADERCVIAQATYEGAFTCGLARGNYVGMQFHPEKSGRVGLALLARFAQWDGSSAESPETVTAAGTS